MNQYKATQISVKRHSRKQRRGGAVPADPALNANYCDQHVSQCKDFYSTCQQGGLNRSPNNKRYRNNNKSETNHQNNKLRNSKNNRQNRRRHIRGGAVPADPALNPTYCDQHVSQCKDFYSTCQQGGTLINPSINPSFCDAHATQCTDHYSGCGGGGGGNRSLDNEKSYKEYKKYKKLYKQLKHSH